MNKCKKDQRCKDSMTNRQEKNQSNAKYQQADAQR